MWLWSGSAQLVLASVVRILMFSPQVVAYAVNHLYVCLFSGDFLLESKFEFCLAFVPIYISGLIQNRPCIISKGMELFFFLVTLGMLNRVV